MIPLLGLVFVVWLALVINASTFWTEVMLAAYVLAYGILTIRRRT